MVDENYQKVIIEMLANQNKVLGMMLGENEIKTHKCAKTKFEDFACNFLKKHKNIVRPTTYENYKWHLNKKIIPRLEGYFIDDIDSKEIQDYINYQNNLGMSPHTIRDEVGIIKLIVKEYRKDSGLPPIQVDIKFPKKVQNEHIQKVLTDEEFKKLYDFCYVNLNSKTITILLTMCLGIRIGEACGLKWGDIDFKNDTISIQRSVKRVASQIEVSDPKTESSKRNLPIPLNLKEALASLRQDDNIYIATGRERPTEPRTFRQLYGRILNKLGIRHHTYHDLRHTFASRAISNGVDAKTVSELLGHTTIEMTLNTYTHISEKQKREAVQNVFNGL